MLTLSSCDAALKLVLELQYKQLYCISGWIFSFIWWVLLNTERLLLVLLSWGRECLIWCLNELRQAGICKECGWYIGFLGFTYHSGVGSPAWVIIAPAIISVCTQTKQTSGRTREGNVLYVLDLMPRSNRLQVSQRMINNTPAQTHFFPSQANIYSSITSSLLIKQKSRISFEL